MDHSIILFLVWLWYFNGLVFIPGGYSEYYCGSSFITTANVQWLINGTRLEDLNLTRVGTYYDQYTGQGVLRFHRNNEVL